MSIFIGLFIGFLLPIQTTMNASLSKRLYSSILTTLITFVVGAIPLIVLTIIIDGSLLFPMDYFTTFPIWSWLGGLLGVLYLLGNIALFERLGTTQTAILPVLGQILMGLCIDTFGLFDSPKLEQSIYTLLGAVLVIIGVIGSVLLAPNKKIEQTNSIMLSKTKQLIWQFIGILVGAISAIQTAINGKLGVLFQSSVKATLVSFIIGILAVLIVLIMTRTNIKVFKQEQLLTPIWMWLGGIIGFIFVLGSVFIAPLIGTGLTVITILIGLTIGSLCIEQFGWLNAPKKQIHPYQLMSLCVMIIGVCIIQFIH